MEMQVSADGQLIDVSVRFKGEGRASVIMLVDDKTKKLVYEAAAGGVARTFEIWDSTNILAMGCDLAIVDPTLLEEAEWNILCEAYESYIDTQFKMLLVRSNPYKAEMPRRNVINAGCEITVSYLNEQILRASRAPKSQEVWRKKERQISRLMYMLHCLDSSGLRLRDVADRFDITMRTVQRDLEVLLAADYFIEDGDEPGTYRFPAGYRSYCAHCLDNPVTIE